MAEFAELPGFDQEGIGSDELTFARAVALYGAIDRDQRYKLVALHTGVDPDGNRIELLVVDLRCDQVPTENPAGIEYPERLAILIRGSKETLPEVYPMRVGFPALAHMSWPPDGYPRNLCLYREGPLAVLRSWTAEKFLERINWWLGRTANGTLHPADQPVEPLFFVTRHELILPGDLIDRVGRREIFYIRSQVTRKDGATLFVDSTAVQPELRQSLDCTLLTLQTPPIVADVVEGETQTLGALHDQLVKRGVDLRAELCTQLCKMIDFGGVLPPKEIGETLLLCFAPLTRAKGGQVEATYKRGFYLKEDAVRLGASLGAFLYGAPTGRYYQGIESTPEGDWRAIPVIPLEVLFVPDQRHARILSAVAEPGPRGALVGAGALGSALLDLWVRSGWGQWDVIDDDHVKPHNLIRHTSPARGVGFPKVEVVASHARAIGIVGTEVTPHFSNPMRDASTNVPDLLDSSELVVDATASVDFSRWASGKKHGRQVSVYITPDGTGGVLMIEDRARSIPLLSLEAQYYRGVISNDWGSNHLTSAVGHVKSGASCRDISAILPNSAVLAHAVTQSEQIIRLSSQDDASIRVWVREMQTGGVQAFPIPANADIILSLANFKVHIDEGLIAQLRSARIAALPQETGGVLLGFWDFNIDSLVVVDVLLAPPDSESTTTSFTRGKESLAPAVEEAKRRTLGEVDYIGEWHSHPKNHSADPSSTDLVQLSGLALRMSVEGLPVASLIVGENDIRVMVGKAVLGDYAPDAPNLIEATSATVCK